MEKKLTLGSFIRDGIPGSFQHYFKHKMPDGGEICLEACLNGYCVARYDKDLNIIGEKICTNMEGMLDMQITPGFSMGTGDALQKAVVIANTLV